MESESWKEFEARIIGRVNTEYGREIMSKKIVLVEFMSLGSPMFQMYHSVLPYLQRKNSRIDFRRLNGSYYKSKVHQLGMGTLPSYALYEDGKLKWAKELKEIVSMFRSVGPAYGLTVRYDTIGDVFLPHDEVLKGCLQSLMQSQMHSLRAGDLENSP